MSVEIQKINNNLYQLVFHPSDVKSKSDGHEWASLVQAYFDRKKKCIEDIDHDPESDMYSATSSKSEALEEIKTVIETLISNSNLYEELLSKISEQKDGESYDKEFAPYFLNWMAESGYDMSSPRQFRFEINGFKDINQAETIKNEIMSKGYETYVHIFEEHVYIFQVIAFLIPSVNLVQEVELYIQSIILKYNLDYEGFNVHNIENA